MSTRHLPVRPHLGQLRHQARDLQRAARAGDAEAIEQLREHLPSPAAAATIKLADAQHALARSYGVASWPRLVLACNLIDAIWRDDADAVRALIARHPPLLHGMARGTASCNWGPPMSYAANLGRDRIIRLLFDAGARDLEHAAGRAALQGHVDTARMLHAMAGSPALPADAVMGPCEAQNAAGLALVLDLGAPIADRTGDWRAPVAMLLETYGRHPQGKHACLELLAARGIALPDTPAMALHRGRVDLLEPHVHRDPAVLRRPLSRDEIYPLELGCHRGEWPAHGAPLDGATLLHLAIDYGDLEMARWLLDRGASPNVRAAIDADGFGGHTPIFSAVVSWAYHVRARFARPKPARDFFAELLLDRGADLTVRVSLRSQMPEEAVQEYRDVTPLSWGRRFHARDRVSAPALRLLEARGAPE